MRLWNPAASILVSLISMAEQFNCEVYYEGDEDRVVLEGLARAGLLRPTWQIAKRGKEEKKKFDGWTGMVQQMTLVSLPGVPSRFVVLIDFDDLQPDQLQQRVLSESSKHIPKTLSLAIDPTPAHPRIRAMKLSGDGKERRIAMVPVGLPGNPHLRDHHRLEEFAMDDYLLGLVCHPEIYEAAGKKEAKVKAVPQSLLMQKFDEMRELLRKNGLKVTRAKRLLDFFRIVIGFRVAPATLDEQFIKAAIEALAGSRLPELRQLFHPLIDDLDAAAAWLHA